MMTHLSGGLLRRYLDEPAAVSDADQAHLSGCPRCLDELGRVGQDRDVVAQALATGDGDGSAQAGPTCSMDDLGRSTDDLDQAWATLQRRLEGPAPRPGEPDAATAATSATAGTAATAVSAGTAATAAAVASTRRRPWLLQRAVSRPVTAAVTAGFLVLGGGAAAAAADWLPIFKTEKVTPVAISDPDLAGIDQLAKQLDKIAELSAYGEVVVPPPVQPSPVPDAATAAARTGLVVPRVPALPTGVEGSPEYLVVDQQNLEFTFSAAKAADSARTRGVTLPPIPPGLDGTRLRIQGGPGVAAVWRQPSGIPTLVVARAKPLTAATQGASLQSVREYLLSFPGVSPRLADQLRAVTGDGTTLPIPVPATVATSSQTDLNGVPATVVETKDHLMVGVLWVERGELNVVLGPLSRDEVLAVARGLR